MALYKDRGVVVGGFRLGEADKVVTLLTEGRGVLRAVAKGVRKTKSRFGGRLEALSHVAVLVYEGRTLDVISQVETITPYVVVRSAPDRVGTGFALVEAAVRASHEHEAAPRLYRLLTAGLAGLEALPPGDPVPPLYLTAFLLRLLDVAGFAFAVDACASCGGGPKIERVGVAEGGVLCDACASPGSYRVRPDTLTVLSRLAKGRVSETAVLASGAPGAPEAAALVRRFAEYHLDVRLRAPAIVANL